MIPLEKFKPNNISVLKMQDESIVIIYNFETTDESTDFMQNIIEKYNFKLSVSINAKKEFNLFLTFPEREEVMEFRTGKTVKHYASLALLTENRTASLSAGTKRADGQLEVYQPPKPLDPIQMN